MTPFTYDQIIVSGLIFLLGLLIGMFLMAGGKWKRLYREEAARTKALELENQQLRKDEREMESLRNAAVRSGHRDIDERPEYREVDERPVQP